MPLYQVVFLAVLQGITEFLPISSSAHLALTPWLFGWKDQTLVFDIALHLGTLLSILLYFWRDWIQLACQGFGIRYTNDPELGKNPRLMWLIALATVPVGIAGLTLGDQAENVWRFNHLLIGAMLIGVGLLILLAERLGQRRKGIGEITFMDTMLIGLAQALALVPGTSRSGVTITTGLFRNIDRAAAARFSFLLSTPAIAAAAAKAVFERIKPGGVAPDMRLSFILGVVISAITGCLVIAFLLRYLREHTLKFFGYYRIVFGIMIMVLATIFRYRAG